MAKLGSLLSGGSKILRKAGRAVSWLLLLVLLGGRPELAIAGHGSWTAHQYKVQDPSPCCYVGWTRMNAENWYDFGHSAFQLRYAQGAGLIVHRDAQCSRAPRQLSPSRRDDGVEQRGTSIFSTRANDGTRLTVDGIDAINNWANGALRTVSSAPITMSAGPHEILVEYYDLLQTGETAGQAEMEMRWSCSSCAPSIPDQVIPFSALQPAWLNQTSEVSTDGTVYFRHFADAAEGTPDYELVTLADGTNVITSYAYDSVGRVTQKVMPKGNAGRTIDAQGNLLGTADLTYSTGWTYYAFDASATPPPSCGGSAVNQGGLLQSLQHRGMAATTYVYDSGGRSVAVTDGGGTFCRTFNNEGRLVQDRAPGESQATTYAYDPAGALRSASDTGGTVQAEYDEAGRLVRSRDAFGAETSLAYDPEGNILTRSAATGPLASNPNYTTSFTHDAAGQLSSLIDPAGRAYAFSYDSRGNPRTIQYPNGTFSWTDYNPAGWPTAVYHRHGALPSPLPSYVPADSQGSPIADFSYGYDVAAQLTQETRSAGGMPTRTTSYRYDALGRLYEAGLPDGTVRSYSYDLDSNRTRVSETPPGGTQTVIASFTYDPAQSPGLDQLTSVAQGGSTTSFAYNSDGDVTGRGADQITWDGRGRMLGGAFGASVSYGFDAIGRRTSRTSAGTITRFLYACGCQDCPPLFETTNSGTIRLAAVEGHVGDLAHYEGEPTAGTTAKFLYYGANGELTARADSAGARTDYYSYDPFGAALDPVPSSSVIERWKGRWSKQLDTTTSLIQMGVRPYDPALGRFLSVDPVEGGSLNPYEYAGQDPINKQDLDGRWHWCTISCVVSSTSLAGRYSGLTRWCLWVIRACVVFKFLFLCIPAVACVAGASYTMARLYYRCKAECT